MYTSTHKSIEALSLSLSVATISISHTYLPDMYVPVPLHAYLRRYQFVLVVTKSKKEKIDLHNLNWLHLGRQETTKSYNGWQE